MHAATPWSPWEALGPNPGPRAPETPRLTAGRDPPKRHLGHLGRCGGGVALEELWGVPLVFGASDRQAGVSEPPRTGSWRIKLVPLRSVKSIMQLMVQTTRNEVGGGAVQAFQVWDLGMLHRATPGGVQERCVPLGSAETHLIFVLNVLKSVQRLITWSVVRSLE